jgi:trehalose/maltose transport system substrate-binding protein
MSGQIFISYRREDSAASAGRVYDRLNGRFPSNRIFIDVDNIAPGVDFVKAIEKSVGSCDVLISIVGKHWLTATDEDGKRRLDSPDDFVRLEIATALKRGIRVIPVLVDGALMPRAGDLPDELKSLIRLQALKVSQDRFRSDSEPLLTAVGQALKEARAERRKRGLTFPGKRTWLSVVGVVTVLSLVAVAAIYFSSHPSKPPTREVVAQPVTPESVAVHLFGDNSAGKGGQWTKTHAQEWAQKTGNTLQYIDRPIDSSAALQEFQKYWAAKSADIDVYIIDVIWPGIAAPYSVDLKKYFKEAEINEHFPRIIQNNTVNGQLVGMPFFADAGLLYYRTDLLEKYDFKEPPKTWEKLAEMAKKIQDAERQSGKPNFQGYVFQGKASESVTCNAIEWIYSFGGGTVVDPDKKVTINNPNAIKALDMARSWIGAISPQGVTTYGEEEARNIWQSGNAAFMRNWPYAYALSEDPKSPISGKFAVTVLPKGGENGKNAACLGGWQLMVSKYSMHPKVAADLVRYLCSSEIQKLRAIDLSLLPTRPDLYKDQEVLAATPWLASVLEILNNAVARPSTVTGTDYNQLSMAIFQNVNKVLNGGESARDAVAQIEQTAQSMQR